MIASFLKVLVIISVLSKGNLCIVSDCTYVVNTCGWLKRHSFNPSLVSKLDNADLWHAVCEAIQGRCDVVSMMKARAHVGGLSSFQDPWKHNTEADMNSKPTKLFQSKHAEALSDVSAGLDLQTHL